MNVLKALCIQPQTNRQYEVYRFRQTKQNQEESLDRFHTRLRTLAHNCEFAEDNLELEIEQQILVGGMSSRYLYTGFKRPKIYPKRHAHRRAMCRKAWFH